MLPSSFPALGVCRRHPPKKKPRLAEQEVKLVALDLATAAIKMDVEARAEESEATQWEALRVGAAAKAKEEEEAAKEEAELQTFAAQFRAPDIFVQTSRELW